MAGLTLLAMVAAGCGADGAASPTAPPTPSASPVPILHPSATPVPTISAPIEIDPGLLAILPAEIDGQPVDESPEVEEADAEDPTLVGVARLAAAFVHDDNAANWAVVTVAAIQPNVLTDAYFRSWRDSFDAGACEPAGGVTGTAIAPIGGRDVNIGRCAGGVNTYHVRLDEDRIVSVTAFGDKRYGELVMGGLKP